MKQHRFEAPGKDIRHPCGQHNDVKNRRCGSSEQRCPSLLGHLERRQRPEHDTRSGPGNLSRLFRATGCGDEDPAEHEGLSSDPSSFEKVQFRQSEQVCS